MPGYGQDAPYGSLGYKGEDLATTFKPDRLNTTTGRCLRLAVMKSQGIGWTEFGGDDFAWPFQFVSPVAVKDANGHVRYKILDKKTGRWYEFHTRQGPDGSGIVKVWRDKVSQYAGAEIGWRIGLKEISDPESYKKFEHFVTHAGFQPQEPENKGNADYDENGMRPAQRINTWFLADGVQSPAAEAKEVPFNGDFTMDKKLVARRLQEFVGGTASEFKIVKVHHRYLIKDRPGNRSERHMTEHTWQENLSDPVFWVSRTIDPLQNIASAAGESCSGSYFSREVGPDTLEDSALIMAIEDTVSAPLAINGDFTFMISLRDVENGLDVLRLGALRLEVEEVAGSMRLLYEDGVNSHDIKLSWKNTDWVTLKVSRKGNELTVSENGKLVNTFILSETGSFGPTITIFDTVHTGSFFDCRMFNKLVDIPTFEYYYDNLIKDKGKNICPIW